MGGNALKNCGTKRIPAAEYFPLCEKVKKDILKFAPNSSVEVIQAYRKKIDFGDMDVLVSTADRKGDFFDNLAKLWESKEVVKNGDCCSMELDGFQIDVISTPLNHFNFSATYFAWNDLGNLMGRIAHKMGVKFGHDGLKYVIRDGDHSLQEIVLTLNVERAVKWMQFDYERWKEGFDTLEDIFEFVAANPLFNPDIYLLDQVNHIARIRDRKRKTYMTFLDWCEEYKKKNPDRKYYQFADKSSYLEKIRTDFPMASQQITAAHQAFAWTRYKAEKFNGELVMGSTGLEGKELGLFMQAWFAHMGGKSSQKFENWVLDTSSDKKRRDLQAFLQSRNEQKAV